MSFAHVCIARSALGHLADAPSKPTPAVSDDELLGEGKFATNGKNGTGGSNSTEEVGIHSVFSYLTVAPRILRLYAMGLGVRSLSSAFVERALALSVTMKSKDP